MNEIDQTVCPDKNRLTRSLARICRRSPPLHLHRPSARNCEIATTVLLGAAFGPPCAEKKASESDQMCAPPRHLPNKKQALLREGAPMRRMFVRSFAPVVVATLS